MLRAPPCTLTLGCMIVGLSLAAEGERDDKIVRKRERQREEEVRERQLLREGGDERVLVREQPQRVRETPSKELAEREETTSE